MPKGKYIRTEKQKNKISDTKKRLKQTPDKKYWFKKGFIPWNKGNKGSIPWNKGLTKEDSRVAKNTNGGSRKTQFKKGCEGAKGENNWNWKGGISKLRCRLYMSGKHNDWRRKVFERDNYTCKECGVIGGKLQVHHIKPFELILKENNVKTFEDTLNCRIMEYRLWKNFM